MQARWAAPGPRQRALFYACLSIVFLGKSSALCEKLAGGQAAESHENKQQTWVCARKHCTCPMAAGVQPTNAHAARFNSCPDRLLPRHPLFVPACVTSQCPLPPVPWCPVVLHGWCALHVAALVLLHYTLARLLAGSRTG